MDLLADENVPWPVVLRLRVDGWTVHSIAETNAGISDTEVLAKAGSNSLLIITQDNDFGMLCVLRGLPVSGILLLELARLRLPSQVERIASFLKTQGHLLVGHLAVLEPHRHRLRALPTPAKS